MVGIMNTFAVIQNNIVINLILADTKEIAEEVTGLTCLMADANIGDLYEPESGLFFSPEELPEFQPPISELIPIVEEPAE
jgi:hypothetical protein